MEVSVNTGMQQRPEGAGMSMPSGAMGGGMESQRMQTGSGEMPTGGMGDRMSQGRTGSTMTLMGGPSAGEMPPAGVGQQPRSGAGEMPAGPTQGTSGRTAMGGRSNTGEMPRGGPSLESPGVSPGGALGEMPPLSQGKRGRVTAERSGQGLTLSGTWTISFTLDSDA